MLLILQALHFILQRRERKSRELICAFNLAGIAFDPATNRVFITGKYWPRLYEIRAVLQSASPNALELLEVRQSCVRSNSGF